MTGLPLTSRLRKSQTSYPSKLEVPQENPTFFPAAVLCPFFSRTEVLNSVSHRIIMIYTSLRCILNISLSRIKIRSHLFGKPVLVCRTLEKALTHWSNFAFVSKPRERRNEKKIHERKHPKHVFLKTNYAEIILQKCNEIFARIEANQHERASCLLHKNCGKTAPTRATTNK